MRKTLVGLVVFLALIFLFLRFGYKPLSDNLGLRQHAGVLIQSSKQSTVYLDGKEKGATPFKDTNLSDGMVSVKVVDASSSAQWQGRVKLTSGTLTVINR